jgi:tRNA pseudouridine38-40 synthase
MNNYLATVSYLGKAYKGFERQPQYPTIQGKIEESLSTLLGKTTEIHGAGRTDAGVNAKGQTFSFFTDDLIHDRSYFVYALNRLLPKDIVVLSLRQVPPEFDARHSCAGKVYSYSFHYGVRNTFAVDEYQLEYPKFDFSLFQAAMKLFEGEHNFQNFTTKPEDKDRYIRTISSIKFAFDATTGHMKVTLQGNGFMTYMVRIMVGTAFKVAMGKMSLKEVSTLLNAKKRTIISYKAPAEGLCLEEVLYER